ncbi:MAG: dienelactone hydrolase family protein [Acidimicrobiales bacterium]
MADSVNPSQNVSFPSNGNEAHGYVALPEGGRGPGVIVIQEWWGLTSHIVDITDRLAREGFVALAPDLFGGATTHDAGEAQKLMSSLPADRAARDLAGAVDYLLGRTEVTGEKVGAIGFCMGGGFVLTLAQQQGDRVAAAVPFYGVMAEVPDDLSNLTADIQGHYGEQDDFVPVDGVRRLADTIEQQAGKKPEIHFYPAGHAFCNDENLLGTYDPEQATKAWDRAVSFLHAKLG